MGLVQIQMEIHQRVSDIESAHAPWPCRKGCDDCCRSLASVPLVTEAEWQLISEALDALPTELSATLTQRIRESSTATRPITCPLLDRDTGSCTIYAARPLACRTYGFYAERQYVLGCSRIEQLAEANPTIVWGNHLSLESRLAPLGESAPLFAWLFANLPA